MAVLDSISALVINPNTELKYLNQTPGMFCCCMLHKVNLNIAKVYGSLSDYQLLHISHIQSLSFMLNNLKKHPSEIEISGPLTLYLFLLVATFVVC